jgi:DNA repair protein RadC
MQEEKHFKNHLNFLAMNNLKECRLISKTAKKEAAPQILEAANAKPIFEDFFHNNKCKIAVMLLRQYKKIIKINASLLDELMILKMAILENAVGVIVGIEKESSAAIRIEKEIKFGKKLSYSFEGTGIKILDVLIITINNFYSMADENDLFGGYYTYEAGSCKKEKFNYLGSLEIEKKFSMKIGNKKISDSKSAAEILRGFFHKNQILQNTIGVREAFIVLFLDKKDNIISINLHTIGIVNATIINIANIAAMAILNDAKSIVLCHNHPSGNLQPSSADIQSTSNIKKVLRYFDVEVKDHIILSDEKYLSMKIEGYF